ncbi:MAG: histidine kinase [Cyclobacteriaceae bacterium]
MESCVKRNRIRGKGVKAHLRDVALALLVFGPITLFFTCDTCYSQTIGLAIASAIYSGYLWVFLWKGNELGADWLDYKFDWLERPLTRLIVSVLYTIFYTMAVLMVGYYFFFTLYVGRDFSSLFYNADDYIWFTIIITFFISTFMHGRGFFFAWRQAAVDNEKLKREQLSSQYESLKKQVNPHFLFNSLNTLSSLVHSDAALSEKFIKKLSDVYRYVLDSQDQEVVDLKDELAFTESFVFLQKIRHGDALKVEIDLNAADLNKKVPPLALQMLVENAIKHNVISKAKPLTISIIAENEGVIVSNNLQKRKDAEPGRGIGINNIKLRYEYLSDRKLENLSTEDTYSTKIPLLTFTD